MARAPTLASIRPVVLGQRLDHDPAQAHLERFLATNPGDGDASELLSAVVFMQGPGWVDCLAVRGGHLIDAGDPRAGAMECEAALERDPFHPMARMFLAKACRESGDPEAAARHAVIARALYPAE